MNKSSAIIMVFLSFALTGCKLLVPQTFESYAALNSLGVDSQMQGLTVRFFGTTTIWISDGETSIMIDGFFSRPSLPQLLLGKIEPNEYRINKALARGSVKKLDALLVAHSHHDHAMDAPTVARKTGALLAGSESTANIARSEKFDGNRIRVIKHGDMLCFRQFHVDVFELPHAPTPFLFEGTIGESFKTPARVWNYKYDKNFNFLLRHNLGNVLIVPSASFKLGLLDGKKVDVVFLSIALLGNRKKRDIELYWNEHVRKTEAKIVIPVHWDDITRSLKKPLQRFPDFIDNTSHAMEVLRELAQRDRVDIRFIPLFDLVMLPKLTGRPDHCIGTKCAEILRSDL